MKQIIFKHLDTNIINAGFLTEDGTVICACCGGIIPAKNIIILETLNGWTDLQAAICANVDITKYFKGAAA